MPGSPVSGVGVIHFNHSRNTPVLHVTHSTAGWDGVTRKPTGGHGNVTGGSGYPRRTRLVGFSCLNRWRVGGGSGVSLSRFHGVPRRVGAVTTAPTVPNGSNRYNRTGLSPASLPWPPPVAPRCSAAPMGYAPCAHRSHAWRTRSSARHTAHDNAIPLSLVSVRRSQTRRVTVSEPRRAGQHAPSGRDVSNRVARSAPVPYRGYRLPGNHYKTGNAPCT